MTLFDLDVQVWLQPGLPQAGRDWLLFHTGCRLTGQPEQADFAVIWDVDQAPPLAAFHPGTPEYPEASTTLLMQVESLTQGEEVTLKGPGILDSVTASPQVSSGFWRQRQDHQHYPLGIDIMCLWNSQILGLPRSVQVVGSSR